MYLIRLKVRNGGWAFDMFYKKKKKKNINISNCWDLLLK